MAPNDLLETPPEILAAMMAILGEQARQEQQKALHDKLASRVK